MSVTLFGTRQTSHVKESALAVNLLNGFLASVDCGVETLFDGSVVVVVVEDSFALSVKLTSPPPLTS